MRRTRWDHGPRPTPESRYALSRTITDREASVIQLVAEGNTNKDVATAIGTTELVIKNYLCVIYDKLGLWNRTELALWYMARQSE